MSLPANFQFNQGNLQDYIECKRRFQLRYLLKVAWPAVKSQPVQESEFLMFQGNRFHRMLQQVFSGIPVEQISAQEMEPELGLWWSNFLAYIPQELQIDLDQLPQDCLAPELSLSAQSGEYRVNGKFDLLVNRLPEKILILDWKTSRRAARREILAIRVQTQLYPNLLVNAGNYLNDGRSILPEQVEMIYWYAAQPDRLVRFSYHLDQYERDKRFLMTLMNEIANLADDQFQLTTNEKSCQYCVYRSLCERGVSAGNFESEQEADETTILADLYLDFDQIGEIEF